MNLGWAEEDDISELQEAFVRLGKVGAKGENHRIEAVVPPGSGPDVKGVKIDKQVVRWPDPPVLGLDDVDSEGRGQKA